MKTLQGWSGWLAAASGLLLLLSPIRTWADNEPSKPAHLPPVQVAPVPLPGEIDEYGGYPPAVVSDYVAPEQDAPVESLNPEPGIMRLDDADLFAPVAGLAYTDNDFATCRPAPQAWHAPVLYPHDTSYAPTGFGLLDWYRRQTAGFSMAARERMLIQQYNERIDWAQQNPNCGTWSCWGHMCDECCGHGCRTFVLTKPECLFTEEEHCPGHHHGHACHNSEAHYWSAESQPEHDHGHAAEGDHHSMNVSADNGIQLVGHVEEAPGVFRLGAAPQAVGVVRLADGEAAPAAPAPAPVAAPPAAPAAPTQPYSIPAPLMQHPQASHQTHAAPLQAAPAQGMPQQPMAYRGQPHPGCGVQGCGVQSCGVQGCTNPGCVSAGGCQAGGCQSGGCQSGGCKSCKHGRWTKRKDLFGREYYAYDQPLFGRHGSMFGGGGGMFSSGGNGGYDECEDDSHCFCPLCCMRRAMGLMEGGNGLTDGVRALASDARQYGPYSRIPLFGTYRLTYPVNPWYADARDNRVYAAAATGAPTAVPLAPNVEHTMNYGWGIPSSRVTPVSRMPNPYGQPMMAP